MGVADTFRDAFVLRLSEYLNGEDDVSEVRFKIVQIATTLRHSVVPGYLIR